MTVFKGFMTITKRNLNILFLYISIFLAICFAIQKMDLQNTDKSYNMESLDIAVIDRDGGELAKGMASYLKQYHTIKDMPDILLSILCYSLTYIIIAFNKPDVKRRMLCSAVSGKRQNAQLILGYAVIGLAVWVLCTMLPVLMYGKEFLKDPHLPHYLFNSFLMMLVSLSLAFLVGSLVRKEEMISAVVNVVSLDLSFISRVLVSLEVLSKGIKTVARFLPIYWYETGNNLIANNHTFSSTQLKSLYTGYVIQILFALAFLFIALVIIHNRRQSAN